MMYTQGNSKIGIWVPLRLLIIKSSEQLSHTQEIGILCVC